MGEGALRHRNRGEHSLSLPHLLAKPDCLHFFPFTISGTSSGRATKFSRNNERVPSFRFQGVMRHGNEQSTAWLRAKAQPA